MAVGQGSSRKTGEVSVGSTHLHRCMEEAVGRCKWIDAVEEGSCRKWSVSAEVAAVVVGHMGCRRRSTLCIRSGTWMQIRYHPSSQTG